MSMIEELFAGAKLHIRSLRNWEHLQDMQVDNECAGKNVKIWALVLL